MRHLICTLFIIACACVNKLYAQTPYDSFAPETSRPMLGIAETESQTDSILCAVVAGMQNQMLLFVDVSNGEVIASAPLMDDVYKWLSVDPLTGDYPHISPYAYCGWNPVKFVDPDGKYFDEANEEVAKKIEATAREKMEIVKNDDDRMREISSTLKDIEDMRNDKQHDFRFASKSDDIGENSYSGENKEGDQIITIYSKLKDLKNGINAHEWRHGGQIARGEMFYDKKGKLRNYGVQKEVDAYKAQWAWQGYLQVPIILDNGIPSIASPGYLNINSDFVNRIADGYLSTVFLYPPNGLSRTRWNNH